MRNLLSLVLFSFVILMTACQSGGGDSSSLVDGYRTEIYDRPGGDKVMPGQYIKFELDILNDKAEVVQSLRSQPTKPIMYIPMEGEDAQRNPLIDLLSQSQKNDSLAIFISKDSMPDPAPIMGENAFLEYRMKVLDIMSKEDYEIMKNEEQAAAMELAGKMKELEAGALEESAQILNDYKAGKYKGQTKSLDNGLKYVLLSEGSGPASNTGQTIEVSYVGMLKDGTMFDNSYRAGRNFSFQIGTGQVIPGWDTGMALMPVGSKALLDIPPSIGYGERGSPPVIPANADLYFVVEVFSIK